MNCWRLPHNAESITTFWVLALELHPEGCGCWWCSNGPPTFDHFLAPNSSWLLAIVHSLSPTLKQPHTHHNHVCIKRYRSINKQETCIEVKALEIESYCYATIIFGGYNQGNFQTQPLYHFQAPKWEDKGLCKIYHPNDLCCRIASILTLQPT